jgi:hypothetical protein
MSHAKQSTTPIGVSMYPNMWIVVSLPSDSSHEFSFAKITIPRLKTISRDPTSNGNLLALTGSAFWEKATEEKEFSIVEVGVPGGRGGTGTDIY